MKRSNVSKVFGATLLGLSLATLPLTLPADAQTSSSPGANTTTTTTDSNYTRGETRGDRDFDWGWLGLLGLLGLAGLAGRKREEPARYRDPDETARPGARY